MISRHFEFYYFLGINYLKYKFKTTVMYFREQWWIFDHK
jgi:hypothetical protein